MKIYNPQSLKMLIVSSVIASFYCLAASHEVSGASIQRESIVLGSGCFWGAEKRLEQVNGVIDAVSGYADGKNIKPTYKAITQSKNKFNDDNYAEVVQVTYNPSTVTAEMLIRHFFEHHDPTQKNRQGNDVGTQYRSTILYSNEADRQTAEHVKEEYQTLLSAKGFGKIQTKIAPLDKFHPAEKYHQDYLQKNPNGYCPDHSTGVTFAPKTEDTKADNKPLLTGKHIVVLEAPFCPYCKAFKEQVGNSYQGDIPMHYRFSDNLDGLTLKTETWATPTIFFIANGREVFGHQGFMTPKEFYQALGEFKLGKDSEAYEIAFEDGTESRFCKKYDLFKNTGDGVFIDILSGEPLFDTKYRFNSGSGWLSFTEAVPDSTIEIPDNRFGLKRIEVRAKKTNIHLGHVLEDGPNGSRRFCINANVLTFKPRTSKNSAE